MATIRFLIRAAKSNLAPIYVRLSAGRGVTLTVNSGLVVDPDRWSNKTGTIKQRITTDDDDELTDKIGKLRTEIERAYKRQPDRVSKEWLENIVYLFHNQKEKEAKTLNEFITKFIEDTGSGAVKGKGGKNIAPGTVRGWKGFQRIFNEYQGVYTDKRLKALKTQGKAIRERVNIDFEDVTIDFYNDFTSFLIDEGYTTNTTGRFIKVLKHMMSRSLGVKLHNNREFKETAFTGMTEDTFTVYLTLDEIEKIYNHDLRTYPRMELARDKFIVLCETGLRVSDYNKIDLNIRTVKGTPYIYIYQTKTGDPVIIPLTQRMEAILNKYNGLLPTIPEQYVNEYIKIIAKWCGINEVLRWETTKYGKRYAKSSPKYKLITCHTGRRSAATNMYKAGIKVIDVMRITGHRTEAAFMRYIRITNEEVAQDLAQHPYFTGSTLKIAK